jgi:hypothetical protein
MIFEIKYKDSTKNHKKVFGSKRLKERVMITEG